MSTGITQHVRRYTSPDGLDLLKPLPQLNRNVAELLAFAHTLRSAGLDLGPRIEKIEQVWDAARTALNYSVTEQVAAIDLETVSPSEVSDIVIRAAIAHTAHQRTSFFEAVQDSGVSVVLDEFDRSLTREAGQLLRDDADRLVKELRKTFTKAAKVVGAAHAAGLSKDTEEGHLLVHGSSEAIKAYRDLPAAVADLDRIASIRTDMVRHLAYEANVANPPHPVCSFIGKVETEMQLASAESAWDGEVEHVQVDGMLNGSAIYKAQKPRLGGAWLDLLHRGFTLQLNTAAEAGAVSLPEVVA